MLQNGYFPSEVAVVEKRKKGRGKKEEVEEWGGLITQLRRRFAERLSSRTLIRPRFA